MQSLQLMYRATVMIGTLVVGALAYRAYGPEIEKLGPIVTRLQELVAEKLSSEDEADIAAAGFEPIETPAPFTARAEPLSPQLFDEQVQPVSTFPPAAGQPPLVASQPAERGADSPVASVVAQLNRMGVSEYTLHPWGEGGKFYRFRCSAPWGQAGRYSRQFEAIAPEPAAAAQQVLAQVQQWQLAR